MNRRIENIAFGAALALSASPALAGPLQTPAPAIGVGIGAILLIGAGYRTIRSRIK